jgi:hypothetical protein
MKPIIAIASTAAVLLATQREANAFQVSFPSSINRPNQTKKIGLQSLSLQKSNNDESSASNTNQIVQGITSSDVCTSSRREFVTQMLVSATAAATLSKIPAASASENKMSTTPDSNESEVNSKSNGFDPRYFLAGGGCAAFSHGLATPFDVVKTKMQAEPEVFDSGFLDATKSLVQNNGPNILLTGLVPTLVGFGLEGAVKFGVYESLKPAFMSILHTDDKFIPYLAASVGAGIVASLMLCPMERTRIKMVTSGEKSGPVSGN